MVGSLHLYYHTMDLITLNAAAKRQWREIFLYNFFALEIKKLEI